jgi:hypothetical protein
MGFLRFQPQLGHALATVNATNCAQNCQNLPKSTQRQNFGIP